jgi:hypothetical protein
MSAAFLSGGYCPTNASCHSSKLVTKMMSNILTNIMNDNKETNNNDSGRAFESQQRAIDKTKKGPTDWTRKRTEKRTEFTKRMCRERKPVVESKAHQATSLSCSLTQCDF